MYLPRPRWILLGAAAVAAIAAAAWQMWPRTDDQKALVIDASDAALVAQGREIYARACASCHGARLEGQAGWRRRGPDGLLPAPPHDETGHTWHHSDTQLFLLTREGVGAFAPPGYRTAMPAYKGTLSDREIKAVLAYIKSRWPEHIRRRQAEITRRANAAAGG